MKNLNVRRAIWAAVLVYLIGISVFVGSYYWPILPDPDLQANWALSLALIPAAIFGAFVYYRNGDRTNGWVLGIAMFLVAMVLDATITVPLFIIPNGGDHITFFTDPGFWLIAVEYVTVVAAYQKIRTTIMFLKTNKDQKVKQVKIG